MLLGTHLSSICPQSHPVKRIRNRLSPFCILIPKCCCYHKHAGSRLSLRAFCPDAWGTLDKANQLICQPSLSSGEEVGRRAPGDSFIAAGPSGKANGWSRLVSLGG